MDNKNSATGSFLAGVLVGGAVGALLALLFAPKSGRDLRRDIAETGEDLLDKAGTLIKMSNTCSNSKSLIFRRKPPAPWLKDRRCASSAGGGASQRSWA